jgi:hypothetical protein
MSTNMDISSEIVLLTLASKGENPETRKSKDGFTHVAGRHRQVTRKTTTNATREPPSNNSFDVLHQIPENMDEPQIPPLVVAFQRNTKGKMVNTPVLEKIHPIPTSHTKDGEPFKLEEGDVEMDLDEQDLVGIDLVHLEQAYHQQQLYTIPPDQYTKFIRFSSTPQRVPQLDPVLVWASREVNRKSSTSLRKTKRKEAENPPRSSYRRLDTSW